MDWVKFVSVVFLYILGIWTYPSIGEQTVFLDHKDATKYLRFKRNVEWECRNNELFCEQNRYTACVVYREEISEEYCVNQGSHCSSYLECYVVDPCPQNHWNGCRWPIRNGTDQGADEDSDCRPSPCMHDGRCKLEGDNGLTCYCTEGWTGRHCEIHIAVIVVIVLSLSVGVTILVGVLLYRRKVRKERIIRDREELLIQNEVGVTENHAYQPSPMARRTAPIASTSVSNHQQQPVNQLRPLQPKPASGSHPDAKTEQRKRIERQESKQRDETGLPGERNLAWSENPATSVSTEQMDEVDPPAYEEEDSGGMGSARTNGTTEI